MATWWTSNRIWRGSWGTGTSFLNGSLKQRGEGMFSERFLFSLMSLHSFASRVLQKRDVEPRPEYRWSSPDQAARVTKSDHVSVSKQMCRQLSSVLYPTTQLIPKGKESGGMEHMWKRWNDIFFKKLEALYWAGLSWNCSSPAQQMSLIRIASKG